MTDDLDKVRNLINGLSTYTDRLSLYTNIMKMAVILDSLNIGWKTVFSYTNVNDFTLEEMEPFLKSLQDVGLAFVDSSDRFAKIIGSKNKEDDDKRTNLAV